MNPTTSLSTCLRFSRATLSRLFLLTSSLAWLSSAHAQVTIGDPLIDGSDDGNIGGVYIFTNTFGQAGIAATWDFFDNEVVSRQVTPLLFHKTSANVFELTAVGTTVSSSGIGSQTGNAFGLIAGSATVASDYTFGFVDREISYSGSGTALTTVNSNPGVVDFQGSGGFWAFVPSAQGSFDLILGQNYEIGAVTDNDDSTVALFGTANRQYSAQFSISAVPEPATAGMLLGLIALGAVGTRRRRRSLI